MDRPSKAVGNAAKRTDYDHHSPEYAAQPARMNRQFREERPVAWSERHGGFWALTRYSDVAAAAQEPDLFSSRHDVTSTLPSYTGVAIPAPPLAMIPLEVDPPEYHEYRRILKSHFGPAAVDRSAPFIEAVITACLDRRIESGTMDLVADLANPVPAIVTMKILGLPLTDWPKYAEPLHAAVYTVPGTPEHEKAFIDQLWIAQQLAAIVQARRAEPRDDLISTIVGAKFSDGRAVEYESVVAIAYTIMAGGIDTTTALISNSLVWLAAHPDQRARLIEDPDLISLAREEFLRYFSPVQAFARTANEDTQINGCPVSAGERVLLSFAAANHDESAFDKPEEVIIDRTPNRHTAFGLGLHRCLGMHFARREFDVLLREVLRRMPGYEVRPDSVEPYGSIGTVNGIISAEMTFAPGPRLGSSLSDVVEGE